MTSSLRILKPIAAAIAQIEGDDAILSDVQCLFAEIKEEIQTALPTSLLLQAEETAVVKSMEKRQEFCMKPLHAAAYTLDPKMYEKSIVSGEEINRAYIVITIMSQHLGLDEGKFLGSLAKYRTKQGPWEGHFPIPLTSAASERNWSLFGHTHTEVRNRLTNAMVEKLVAIRANPRLFEPDTEPSSTRLDSDTESDVEEVDVDEVQEKSVETWKVSEEKR